MSSQDNSPAVAVIIPVYCSTDEHEVYLAEALQSVAAQTFTDFEVIVVDDQSPRDIWPVLNRVAGLRALRVVRNVKNLGHARSRNVGVEATKAEFVAFLDHDDLWAPDKLERQVEKMRKRPDAGMVFCAVKGIGSHAHRLPFDQSIIPCEPSFLWMFYHGNYVITATAALVRREALVEIGFFSPAYTTSDDFDAWLKILRRRPILYLSDALASYRLHSQNVNYTVDRWRDTSLLFRLYVRYWWSAPLRERIAMLPRLAKKTLGRPYYYIFRRMRYRD